MATRLWLEQADMATMDVDLLWDVRKRVQFLQTMRARQLSMVQVLKTADETFERLEEQKEAVMNSTGFSVELLREQDPVPLQDAIPTTDIEGDIYPVQALRANEFLNSPPFEQVVVGISGKMALMRTVDPQKFVEIKRWLSEQPDREQLKRRRDHRQANAVEQLFIDGRLTSKT